jgi:hypothetical protein
MPFGYCCLGEQSLFTARTTGNTDIYKLSTSQKTHYVPSTKPNRLMLFGETVAVYCENHIEHTNTLCGQNAEFYVKADGTHCNHESANG